MPQGGAVHDFDLVRFGGPTVPDEFDVTILTTPTRVLKNDPDRLQVILTNNDLGAIYWSTKPLTVAISGFAVGVGIATLLSVQNDGAWCSSDIWAIAPTGPFTLHVGILRRQSRG